MVEFMPSYAERVDINRYKRDGDHAFSSGRFEEAYAAYENASVNSVPNASILCNKSLAALRLGRASDALKDADLALLALPGTGGAAGDGKLLAKAYHRKAQALAAVGRTVDAVRTYKAALAACGGTPELHAALRLLMDQLPARLLPAQLEEQLERALGPAQLLTEARDLACAAWVQGGRPGRAEAAYFRGRAYLQARDAQQAERDARVALVYGPRLPAERAVVVAADGDGGEEPAPPADRSCWPAALALQSAALEARGDNVPAALSAAHAAELDPGCEEAATALERLLRRIPPPLADILRHQGPAALEQALSADRERSRPEFLRRRPKYYYYYEWMRRRIAERHPTLPAPVMDKLLTMDANELDLLLQYPAATDATVARVRGVYDRGGEESVLQYQVPLLSWEEVKELQGGGVPATLEGPAAQQLLEGAAAAADSAIQVPTPVVGSAQPQERERCGEEATAGAETEEADRGGGQPAVEEEDSDAGSVSLDDDLFELD